MTVITARYAGKCTFTGRSIRAGDRIDYDRWRKTSRLLDDESALQRENDLGDDDGPNLAARTRTSGYISNVFRTSGGEFYRNKRGRCEDAPACGCCTI